MDELTCHAMGERRINYLNQIRCILDQMDDAPCSPACKAGPKPLLEYPGYINRKNPEFKKATFGDPCGRPQEAYQPYLQVPAREKAGNGLPIGPCGRTLAAPTCGQHQSTGHCPRPEPQPHAYPQAEYIGHSGGEAGGSAEYLGGCDCVKHNGLQDQCPRMECIGNPDCLTDPPSCPPARGMPKVNHVNIHQKYENIFCQKLPTEDKHRIC